MKQPKKGKPKSLVALCLEYALADDALARLVNRRDHGGSYGQEFNTLINKRIRAEQALLSAFLRGIGYDLVIKPHMWEVIKTRGKR